MSHKEYKFLLLYINVQSDGFLDFLPVNETKYSEKAAYGVVFLSLIILAYCLFQEVKAAEIEADSQNAFIFHSPVNQWMKARALLPSRHHLPKQGSFPRCCHVIWVFHHQLA